MSPVTTSISVLLIAMLSVQGGASLAKSLFPILGPEVTTLFRVGFSAILLLIIWRPFRHKPSKSFLKKTILYGVSLGGMNLLFYCALQRLPLGVAVALEFTGPLTVALLSSRQMIDFIWAILAAAGICLIIPWQVADSSAIDSIGILFALGAGACWAIYILAGKSAGGAEAQAGMTTALGMLFAALTVSPWGLAKLQSEMLRAEILLPAFGVAILSSALPYSLEMIALRRLSTKTFGILMSLEPALAALMGFAFLHEHLLTQQLIAIVCIIIASVGSSVTQKKSQNIKPVEV
jgi:inner membrane transporter RhtA